MPILNPDLYDRMLAAFGRRGVKVCYAGEPLAGFYQPERDPHKSGGVKLHITERGETYTTDCPYCGDTRGRLAVNHRYGVRDPQTGYYGTELWKCYNEECQSVLDNRRDLRDRLYPRGFGIGPAKPCLEAVRPVNPRGLEPCEFPGQLVPLRELQPNHPALTYLTARQFDPAELDREWKVAFAQSVPSRSRESKAQNRIIVPVFRDGLMVGWQGRYIGELDWKAAGVAKYMTFFPKSLTLYGIDEATDEAVVVLVEGVTDVWRYGKGAVSGLGKKLSAVQAQLLAERLGTRTLVLVPDMNDPEAFDCFCDNAARVKSEGYEGKIGIAPLPAGRDPASMTRPKLRSLVERAAALAE